MHTPDMRSDSDALSTKALSKVFEAIPDMWLMS